VHRPVKNREGGPIAGVAYVNGGGSRQLGPDDNDPVSGTQIPEHPTTPFLFHHTTHQEHPLFFPIPITNVTHHEFYPSQIPYLASAFSFVFASNRMPELAAV
jgi:hypothetical protein